MNRYRTVARVLVEVYGEYEADSVEAAFGKAERAAIQAVTVDGSAEGVEWAEWEVSERGTEVEPA